MFPNIYAMKRAFFSIFILLCLAVVTASAQTPSRSIIVDAASFRPVQTDALTGIAIDPIGLDGSKRPCTRLKMRINRMTREEIGELSFRLRGGVIDLRKQVVAHEGNGLIIEMTAYKNTVFYLQHPRFGMSNEVTISTEGNKEYYIEASLNQFYSIVIATNRPDADTYIDGHFVGRTNDDGMLTVDAILPGTHNVKMEYGTSSKEFAIDVNRKSIYFKQELAIETDNKTGGVKQSPTLDFCEMVFVEGGTFTMGATSEQGRDAESDEKPAHSVTVSDFYIGKYEVTQKQWKEIMGSNPSKWTGDNLPVECVSWNDIQEFVQKLNQKTGKRYRLPTEAEWEYAARGGAKSGGYKYSGSNHLDSVAWYWDNSGNKTHPVGQKVPNELGIYDMSGNVWEWCQDWYGGKKYYKNSLQTNPVGPSSGSYRVWRGGSWNDYAMCCRVSYRYRYSPSYGGGNIGFRLVLDSSAKTTTTASTSTNSTAQNSYKVGDYYNVGGKEGVVFEATSDGRHGKIVCLDDLGKMTWYEANKACEQMGNGWYLPAKEELLEIRRLYRILNSTIENRGRELFVYGGAYWSATPREEEPRFKHCAVYSDDTHYSEDSYTHIVRAVAAF